MKYVLALLLCSALALCCMLPGLCEPADGGEAPAEWTLLFYFCGTDLESKHGLATSSLEDMTKATPLEMLDVPDAHIDPIQWDQIEASGKINVVIETGGCSHWHNSNQINLNISEDRLQCYEYQPSDSQKPFSLVMEQPLQSMGSPETLTDFIKWGVANYPARRYGLILWDHGDGARTGLFADELFRNDVMYLYELEQALDEAGVWFECVVIDACMMANLETACALKDHAAYMVASEDLLPGYGTSYDGWLQELYQNPKWGGWKLGQTICDTIDVKYARMEDRMPAMTLTYSLIDLSKIDRLADCFDRWFAILGEAYERSVSATEAMFLILDHSERYIGGNTVMMDLGGAFSEPMASISFGPDFRNEFVSALNEAVVYDVRGNGRSGSCGLSFCQAVGLSPEELDVYAKNCKSPHYLALLDAIVSDWKAPEWIYEKAPRWTKLRWKTGYHPGLTRCMIDKTPAIAVSVEQLNLMTAYYRLSYLDPETDQTLLLGVDSCDISMDENGVCHYFHDIGDTWPSIDQTLCCMSIIREDATMCLYHIPIRMEETIYNLRCSYIYNHELVEKVQEGEHTMNYEGVYQLYGVWEGYNEDSDMPGRNVTSIVQLQGREYQLLYPVLEETEQDGSFYQNSEPLRMYRGMNVEEMSFPEGTYYLTYIGKNVFGQSRELGTIEMEWDGSQFICKTPWEGEIDNITWG